jgi:hypothetical protein
VVVETPQLGHATYVFAKPRNMDTESAGAILGHTTPRERRGAAEEK